MRPFTRRVHLCATILFASSLYACSDGSGAIDAGSDLAVAADLAIRAGDLGPGAECTFNRDCIAEARCACDETSGCACELGPRGTGRNGLDACQTGNDCASSLCVEGPSGGFICSDECRTADDCTGQLPLCVNVALLGKICARDPG